MEKLITLVEFYNHVGRKLYPDWSDDIINCLRDKAGREKFKDFAKQARHVQREARSEILNGEGMLKVCLGQGQRYIDPPFRICDINFPRSICGEISGDYYPCRVNFKPETRGRKKTAGREDAIEAFVQGELIGKGIALNDITAKENVSKTIEHLKASGFKKGISSSTIHRRLLEIKLKSHKK